VTATLVGIMLSPYVHTSGGVVINESEHHVCVVVPLFALVLALTSESKQLRRARDSAALSLMMSDGVLDCTNAFRTALCVMIVGA